MFWKDFTYSSDNLCFAHTHSHARMQQDTVLLNGLSLCDICELQTEIFWEDFTTA